MSYEERARTQVQDNLTLTVSVPTQTEAKAIYGVDLATKGMQPVWIEVKNNGDDPAWLLPSGIDPEYFAASEAAHPFRAKKPAQPGVTMAEHFRDLQFRNPVPAKGSESGFVIVLRDEGFKAVDIDIIAGETARQFSYLIVDPSFKGDFMQVDFDNLYAESAIIDLEDEAALRRAIEEMPCCTSNKKGSADGDPLNLVVIGDPADIFPAFVRRGWHGTEIVWSKALLRTAKSFLAGSKYRYSPISPLYVFGRKQDIAFQKARGTIHERNHLRLWVTPFRFQGNHVWVGQISRDIGVKFTLKSPTISTHVIDPDVDEARRYLAEDLIYSQAMARLAFAAGTGVTPRGEPRYNLVGDPFYTDGLRAVMFFEPRPYALNDVDIITEWERPPGANHDKGLELSDESQ